MKPALTMLVVIAPLLAGGCGAGSVANGGAVGSPQQIAGRVAARALSIDRSRTRLLGHGARFRPPAFGPLFREGASVGRLRCGTPGGHPYGVHIELFADGHEVIVPAGVGIAPPQRRDGASVVRGRCSYPMRTADPTGVILVDPPPAGGATPTIGDLFAIWGQPLGRRRLVGFTASRGVSVAAFVDGRRVQGDPGAIPLSRHAQIVLELGPHVEPHPSYRFQPGM